MTEREAGNQTMDVLSEPISRVITSSVGVSLDSALSKQAGHRIWGEMTAVWDMMLEKTGVTLFIFDLQEDTFYYRQVLPDGTRYARKVRTFHAVLERMARQEGTEHSEMAKELLQAMQKSRSGEMESHSNLFTAMPHLYRMSYRSLSGDTGKVYAIIGFSQQVDGVLVTGPSEAEEDRQEKKSAMSAPEMYGAATGVQLELKVNQALRAMQPGQKGILFLLSIRYPKMSDTQQEQTMVHHVRSAAEAVRADFRNEDILGQVQDNAYVIFMCGNMTIDVIERRAQRMIDLCQRLPMLKLAGVSCSVGIAATSSKHQHYDAMFKQAQIALAEASRHGSNQYRLFEDEKY